jgi:N-acetylglucosamine kinase-like BadF-type ATPase
VSPSGYVVAADGGNSKTELVVSTLGGNVLARATGPGTRPYQDGMDGTAAALADLARRAFDSAGLDRRTRVAAGSFYLANVDLPEDERAMHAELTRLGVADRIDVRNDTFAVLRAGATRR